MIVRIAREGDEVEGGRMRVRMGASIRDRIPSTLIHNVTIYDHAARSDIAEISVLRLKFQNRPP